MKSKSNDIKLILFDLGGVLVRLGDISEMWADKKDGYAAQGFWKLWLQHEAIQAIDSGRMELSTFLHRWIEDWQLETSFDELEAIYRDIVREPYPGALELIEDCKQHYAVACLSNMTAGHWPKIQSFGFADKFDHVFVSCFMKCCKPNRRAYEIVLEQCGYEPHEILFIDDNATNLVPAQELGFNVVEAKTAMGARSALAEIQVL